MIEQIYETICETNDKIITTGEQVVTVCFFIKGGESVAVPLHLTKKDKGQTQLDVKAAALKKGCEGYIIVVDSNTTQFDKKKQVVRRGECILRVLYTPHKKITEIVWYNEGKILSKERYEGRSLVIDAWDAWNESGIEILKTK